MKLTKFLRAFTAFGFAACVAFSGAALPARAEEAPTIETPAGERALAGGYDYTRFADDKLTLNVYNWGEYISDGTDEELLDINAAFEELTGITVQYATFETNESLYSKLKGGGAEYDLIIPSDYMIGKMINEKMLQPLNFDNIPNYAKIGEEYKNQAYDPENEYSVPYTWGYVGLIYNTTMVDGVPDSWDILWDEQYKGDILMFDNSRDAFAIASARLGLSLNPKTREEIEQAGKELEAQRGVVQAYVMDQIFDKMEGGEAALAPYYAGDAITMTDTNPDLAFAIPKETVNLFIDAMCVPATSKKREAAEMYINFLCETPVAVDNTLFIGYSTPQVEAVEALPEEVRDNPISYPPAEKLANMETFNVLSEEMNYYMDNSWNDMRTSNKQENGLLILLVMAAMLALTIFLNVRRALKKRKNNTY